MRIVNLLAMISPDVIGPTLMIAGLAISLGALAFLFWRRRAGSQGGDGATTAASTPIEEGETKVARRRPLVSDPDSVSYEAYGQADEEADSDTIVAGPPAEELEGTEAEWEELEPEEADEAEPEPETEPGVAAAEPTDGEVTEHHDDDQALTENPPIVLPAETEPLSPIEAARWRPILFRQFRPSGPNEASPGEDGLSFFGGKPIGPAHFVWPRGRGEEGGPPLTFVMQWDCARLASQDATGLLPSDGAFYCFLNLDWGNHEDYTQSHTFVHYPGPTDGWSEIGVPDDARPVFGKEGAWQMSYCTQSVDNAETFVPRTLARFPFEPIAVEYPVPETDEEYGEHRFWNDDWAAEAVLAAQKSGQTEAEGTGDIEQPHMPFVRPFPTFPHDFGAIRILAASVLKKLSGSDPHYAERVYPDLTEEERDAQFAQWTEEAKELYQLGCQRPMGHAVEQSIADDIWGWAEAREKQLSLGFHQIVLESVDLSLGVGSEALAAIPEELIDEAMRGHALTSEYMTDERPADSTPEGIEDFKRRKEAGELEQVRKVFTRNPARIFGPPSYVQGYVEEMIDDHLLLLELSSASGPEHHFGEGVLQYLITPDDLAAGRFDQVKAVLSGY